MASDSTDDLKEGDQVTVELDGEVVDTMESHDGVFRIDVQSQKVEILDEEITDIERPARPADTTEEGEE